MAVPKAAAGRWELNLYVTGKTPKSNFAIGNLQKICEEYLKGHYRIVVIDIRENPEIAFREQIIVTPTVVRSLPLPPKRIYGDLSKKQRVLLGLDMVDLPAGEASNGS